MAIEFKNFLMTSICWSYSRGFELTGNHLPPLIRNFDEFCHHLTTSHRQQNYCLTCPTFEAFSMALTDPNSFPSFFVWRLSPAALTVLLFKKLLSRSSVIILTINPTISTDNYLMSIDESSPWQRQICQISYFEKSDYNH